MKYEEYLRDIYYDTSHPAAYTSLDKLYRAVRKEGKFVLSKSKIKRWLSTQEPYTVHKGIVRKFKRRRIVAPRVDYQWEADVAYMNRYTDDNDDYGYFLLVIDVLSKYVWTIALKTVRGQEVATAFNTILNTGRQPERVRTDAGSEFKAKQFQKLLSGRSISHFYSRNETKAAVAERAIKTIKMKLSRYMTRKQSRRWIDVLHDDTQGYNRTYHRTIKRTPASVKSTDAETLWRDAFEVQNNPKRRRQRRDVVASYRFKVGDTVRLSHMRRPFQREYDERWTLEYFVVAERNKRQNIPFYRVKDLQGEVVDGSFYQNELAQMTVDPDALWRIEKVLRRSGNRVLVKWLGWPSKFNSYIPAKDVELYGST